MKRLGTFAAALALTTLAACIPGQEDQGITQDDLLNDFPRTPGEVASTVWKMNCDQLDTVEQVMAQIDTFGPLARPFIRAAPLPQEDRDALLALIDADSQERRDAQLFVDAVQLVKFCG